MVAAMKWSLAILLYICFVMLCAHLTLTLVFAPAFRSETPPLSLKTDLERQP